MATRLPLLRRLSIFSLVTLLGASASAQQAPPPAAPPGPDTPGTGPYPAMKEEVASLPRHVLYRPTNVAAMGGQKLGVVAWGNGGCSDDGASTRFHLLELASHGYLVIASGRILSGPGAPPRPAAAPPPPRPPAAAPGQAPAAPVSLPPPKTTAAQLTEAIDWALKENARSGSPYYGKVDPKQIAVSGFSCGGLQAITAAKDPRVSAVVFQNTGIFVDGPSPISGMDVSKDALLAIHTPVLYILGGATDIAYKNGMDDFKRIEHVPVVAANIQVGHGGTYFQPNGGAAASVAVSWLQWQLRGDKAAQARFVGKDCGLCKDPQWTLEKKKIP
jgi:dienelactone hydrolase